MSRICTEYCDPGPLNHWVGTEVLARGAPDEEEEDEDDEEDEKENDDGEDDEDEDEDDGYSE